MPMEIYHLYILYTYMHMHMYVHIWIYICICIYIYTYVYAYVYVYVCVCACICGRVCATNQLVEQKLVVHMACNFKHWQPWSCWSYGLLHWLFMVCKMQPWAMLFHIFPNIAPAYYAEEQWPLPHSQTWFQGKSRGKVFHFWKNKNHMVSGEKMLQHPFPLLISP